VERSELVLNLPAVQFAENVGIKPIPVSRPVAIYDSRALWLDILDSHLRYGPLNVTLNVQLGPHDELLARMAPERRPACAMKEIGCRARLYPDS
jgi:hypothetical protein